MDDSRVVIATMTRARDAREELLLRESLSRLAGLNVPTFVTDGGSGRRFVEDLRGLPRFGVFEAGAAGVWGQVGRSLRAAHEAGADFILYTEPDKGDFFREGLREFISEAPADDGVGVVLASRSGESFATFPEFQRHTEATINRCCEEALGLRADFTYGPFLLNRKLVPLLSRAPLGLGWGWRPYAFGLARRLGYRISHLEKAPPCPAEQREDDPGERVYRMKQLAQNIQGLVDSLTADTADA
jgi:hypothetical protein